jgi:type VI secretion system FHA domain protein
MPLLLRVEGSGEVRYRGSDPRDLIEVEDRLMIGRDEKNDLVLRDERMAISTDHCRIERLEHGYALIDHSRNGTFLNDTGSAISRDKHFPLDAGDLIRIGGFALHIVSVQTQTPLATLEAPDHEPADAPTPRQDGVVGAAVFGFPDLHRLGPVGPAWSTRDQEFGNGGIEDDGKTTGVAFGGSGARSAFPDHLRPEAAVFVQPTVGCERIPEDWEFSTEASPRDTAKADRPAPSSLEPAPSSLEPAPSSLEPAPSSLEPAPVQVGEPDRAWMGKATSAGTENPEMPETPDAASRAIDAMLGICGLTRGDVPDDRLVEVMSRMAHAFRLALGNLQEILVARSETKQEFGVERTMIARSDNNVLKFSMDMSAAMRSLMLNDVAGFLPAERAVDQAFDDIKTHQVSLVAATQATLQMLVRQLSPGSVTAGMNRGLMARWAPAFDKARAWDRYVQLHRKVDDDLAAGDMSMPAEISSLAFAPRAMSGQPFHRRAENVSAEKGRATT